MRVLFVAVVSLVASCAGPALSFSTGAPREACTTATPNHPATPQSITNPYSIDLSAFDEGGGGFTYLPGRTYQLTLSAAGNSPTFRGFFIQGRLVADDSPVGAFVDPPTGVRLSSCLPSNVAITHNSTTNKRSITVSWIAPSAGTGAVRFAYAVVQIYLIFWANDTTSTIQEGSCAVPFYESGGVCVETCPPNEFGNHTSSQCQPYATGFTASLNATTYVAEITADTPFGTPVLYFSAVIGNPAFTIIFLSFVENDLVERVFRFPNGQISQNFVLTPSAGSNTITIVTQIQYVDDPRNFRPGEGPVTLPATYGMNINLAALNPLTATIVDRSVRAFVTVNPPPDPCQPNPCTNGGTCNAEGTTNYTCTCPPDFTGTNCEVQIDDCVGVDCGNGTCVDGVESFECMCLAGFTGTSCEINIDECETIVCANGECTDLINAIECDCYPGWTGGRCEVDIDYCQPRPFGPCSSTGTVSCSDGNTTYTCNCGVGFTGSNCLQDIDECESIPAMTGEPACFNDGNCTNNLFGRFECSCPSDYSGDRCDTDLTPCEPNPCENGGTCEQSGLEFMCNCPPGYTGSNCSTDLSFCTPTTCMNGGTCTEGRGTMILCDCPTGFTGMMCETDPPDCELNTCDNGGTCVEEYGPATRCICAEGFNGTRCDVDLPFCEVDTCLNGGTCNEGVGTVTTCDCMNGFTGANCSVDLDYCTPETCLNGGTCDEGPGTLTTCDCAAGFTGDNCRVDLPFCQPDTCFNNGTCLEDVGTLTRCECALGFAGIRCGEDDRNYTACEPATCMNGGTCGEEFGPETSCTCPEGYTGPDCGIDLPFCTPETCLNNGTCNEGPGTETTCSCNAGFSGSNCSVDLDYCTPDTCYNNGTCIEELGNGTNCSCHEGFTGTACETDLPFCEEETCLNGGTCFEGLGIKTICECVPGFSGPQCESDLSFCQADSCLNGGTCIEEAGEQTRCVCVPDFTGPDCSQYNTPETTTALFQFRLKPVRECVTWVDERRAQKFMDIVSAVVQQVQMRCSCSFTETNIQNYEFSCRSIENTVVFRAEIIYTSLQQARYRAENLVTLVSGWVQSETSIVVDSTRLDVDPTCPTQLRSFQDGDCVLTDTTGTGGGNVATFASLGVVVGVVLLIICSIIIVIFVVRKKRKHRSFSLTDETYELPQLPTDDSTVKANPARSENVTTSSNPAYGHFQTSRQECNTKEEEKEKRWNKRKQGSFSPADETNAVPALPLQISRQENDTKEDEGEDHTYEPLPFDTPRQEQ